MRVMPQGDQGHGGGYYRHPAPIVAILHRPLEAPSIEHNLAPNTSAEGSQLALPCKTRKRCTCADSKSCRSRPQIEAASQRHGVVPTALVLVLCIKQVGQGFLIHALADTIRRPLNMRQVTMVPCTPVGERRTCPESVYPRDAIIP